MTQQHFLITGPSGFIGRALSAFLLSIGHRVTPLYRVHSAKTEGLQWDPTNGVLDPAVFQGIDVVVHLSGASLNKFWSEKNKRELIQSRIDSTQLLCRTIQTLISPPPVVLIASAIGFYGECGQERVVEGHSPGHTMLSHLCVAWEAASRNLKRFDVRVANLRFGTVLSPEGGALKVFASLFKKGLGVRLPPIWMSWIAMHDLVRALAFIAQNSELSGPINLTAPYPVTWDLFCEQLSQATKRAILTPLPLWFMRLGGSMARELFLTNTRAIPEQLLSHGFLFTYPRLDQILK